MFETINIGKVLHFVDNVIYAMEANALLPGILGTKSAGIGASSAGNQRGALSAVNIIRICTEVDKMSGGKGEWYLFPVLQGREQVWATAVLSPNG